MILQKFTYYFNRFFIGKIYFFLPLSLRVFIKKFFFRHNSTKKNLGMYLKKGVNLYLNNKSYLLYLIENYIKFLKIKNFLELGFFSGIITRILISRNYNLNYYGLDFDSDRISYLKVFFKNKYDKINLDTLDLESKFDYSKFYKKDLIYCGSVLSSIQPESLNYFFKSCKKASVKIIIIHDYKNNFNNSYKFQTKMQSKYINGNWAHDYIYYAKKYYSSNIEIPDISDPFATPNSLYVITNNISKKTHHHIILTAMKNFYKN